MKNFRRTALISAIALLFTMITGCEDLRLVNGKYETMISGREDFAAVYNDLIFLRVRNPQSEGLDGGYWDWAGKYKVDEDGRIMLKMDKEQWRIWNFYYNFYDKRGAIAVADLSAESGFDLKFRPAGGKAAAGRENSGVYR